MEDPHGSCFFAKRLLLLRLATPGDCDPTEELPFAVSFGVGAMIYTVG